ncbi:DeoR/GlpR family DNA-binding transcription regulator [Breznakia pachnodae]|uniref:DeoR family glycerol-3-phosphate regulon repressor n=1 Tax=Breznakia pachnodae TaxID=265178 RepID=A0ABU0E815_9FIRM|nr:DeoR/GlpR family DNA-binding transcription regulator [Breznakia pachnodae]MDQ0363048.1 DeoR family glycerol-3-phosphate regulon repressor [Breznakia pachnodae]
MFVEERQEIILELLRENGRVRVKDLSEKFGVTPDLIRKDLTTMEEKGLLKKAYGGAVLERVNIHRKIASQRKELNTKEKAKIARLALSLINDGDVVFLDISTNSIEVARLLQQSSKQITVVTNMIDVMLTLTKSQTIKVIFIGGELDFGRDGFVGSVAIESIQKYRFDIAFIGVVGVDVFEDNVFTYMDNDGITKKTILAGAKATYMLCESDKFIQGGNYRYAALSDFTGVITDKKPSKEIVKSINNYKLKLIYPEA